MTRPRPLYPNQRNQLAEILEALAAEYRRPGAKQVQRLLGESVDARGFPTSSSGADKTRGSSELTATEGAAIVADPGYIDALAILEHQRQIRHSALTVLYGLRSWHPDRPTETCPTCGNDKPRGATRCPFVDPDTGLQCGARRQTRRCSNCHRFVGGYLTRGQCDACRKRPGRELPPLTGITRHDNGVVTIETTNSEE